jgi:hypothetical protein
MDLLYGYFDADDNFVEGLEGQWYEKSARLEVELAKTAAAAEAKKEADAIAAAATAA